MVRMPLDVKPLSPARRASMVAVMIVLLAASLGFAELLVRRQQQRVAGSATFPIPPDARSPMLVNSDVRRVLELLWIAKQGKILAARPLSCRVGNGLEARRY